MSRQPETTFRKSVERHLPRFLYREKMSNPYRGGTPDSWYSGITGDLWVEYKFMPHVPQSTSILPALSALQRRWLNDRLAESRRVAVVLGSPDGGVIYTAGAWMRAIDTATFVRLMFDRKRIAQWIEGATCRGQSVSWRPPR